MALQGVEDATERRRRAIRRGGGLLDRLDELKLAMLNGQDGAPALERLARSLREERPEDADPGLKGVLDQIDLRAAVEMARRKLSGRAPRSRDKRNRNPGFERGVRTICHTDTPFMKLNDITDSRTPLPRLSRLPIRPMRRRGAR